MRKRVVWLGMLLFCALGVQGNMLVNGEFEDPSLSPWQAVNGGAAEISTDAFSGSQSAKFNVPNYDSADFQQDIAVTSEDVLKTYTLTYTVNTETFTELLGIYPQVGEFNGVDWVWHTEAGWNWRPALTAGWHTFSTKFTMTMDDAHTYRVFFRFAPQGTPKASGSILMDDISFVGPPPGLIAAWSFDEGTSSSARLAASDVAFGATVSGLTMNTDAGGYGFRYAGLTVPNNVHDGYGFGGAGGETVMFLHRANYFDGGGADPVNDYTSFGLGYGGNDPQGTGANLDDGNAPVSFSVTAAVGQTITVSNLLVTVAAVNPGNTLFAGFQQAGGVPGDEVTVDGSGGWVATVPLPALIVISSGETRSFTINLNSGVPNSNHNIDKIELWGAVEGTAVAAAPIVAWDFNEGATSAERLAATHFTDDAVISPLVFNTFEDAGVDAEPNSIHDGFGFISSASEEVIALHRANYFDGSGVPPKESSSDFTSWGLGTGIASAQGSTAGQGDGNAPISFTVTAAAGKRVSIESLTGHHVGGNGFIFSIQEAGADSSATVTLGESGGSRLDALLTSPIIVDSGETKTFTISVNSGALNSKHYINEFVLNGSIFDLKNSNSLYILLE